MPSNHGRPRRSRTASTATARPPKPATPGAAHVRLHAAPDILGCHHVDVRVSRAPTAFGQPSQFRRTCSASPTDLTRSAHGRATPSASASDQRSRRLRAGRIQHAVERRPAVHSKRQPRIRRRGVGFGGNGSSFRPAAHGAIRGEQVARLWFRQTVISCGPGDSRDTSRVELSARFQTVCFPFPWLRAIGYEMRERERGRVAEEAQIEVADKGLSPRRVDECS
jgi:hypothetical protein